MLFAAFAAVLSSISGASASPVQTGDVDVLICVGDNATDPCIRQDYPLNTCIELEPPYYQNVGTFAVFTEGAYCEPHLYDCGQICYSPQGCTAGPVNTTWPYSYDVDERGWRELFKSFLCLAYANGSTS